MQEISIYRKYISPAGIFLLILMSSITIFAEVIEVRIQGFDDGVKSTKQRDHEEAVLFAKREAIERAGVTIKSKTTTENLMSQKDYIEAQSEAVLLPGYHILDIGYLENGKYSIILIGKIKTRDTKGEVDADGFYYAKWGMSLAQVQEAFNFLFTDPNVIMNTPPGGTMTYLTARKTERIINCMVETSYVFNFRGGELYQVRYMELTPPVFSQEKGLISPSCGGVILNRYKNEEDSLYKRYGKPVKSEEYNKIWVLPSTSIATRFIWLKGKTPESDGYIFSLEYEKR